MKKTVSVFLVLLIVFLQLPSFSLADSDPFLNESIHFDDSIETVKAKESNNLLEEDSEYLVYDFQYKEVEGQKKVSI